jgi:hypothetical protein
MVKIADETGLSTKEVQRIVLNKTFFAMGMTCEHRRIGHAKTDGKPYCKDCWTRMNMKQQAINFKGKCIKQVEYEPQDTFLDIKGQINEQDREKYI